ncbi:MAG: GNAT family N-acetyltransferase [Eubacteriales bacterium]|nr:GNAT family N-acetyltransferase [Eubacteriales bacterium]
MATKKEQNQKNSASERKYKSESKVYLHVPSFEELTYRQKLLQEAETMSYNKGYERNIEGYDIETGCIDFSESKWQKWYDHFIGQEPKRFYAYITRSDNDEFIGEVNVREVPGKPWYEMGIVVTASERGKGYAKDALKLLLEVAFEKLQADSVHNFFEDERESAIALHLNCGFSVLSHEEPIIELLITKEEYEQLKH